LVAIAGASIGQIGFLNFAISVAPVAYSVPAYQSVLLVSTLFLSGWVLDEYTNLDALERILFIIGACVVGTGMLLNAWGLARAADTELRQAEAQLRGEEALYGDKKGGSSWLVDFPGAPDAESSAAARKAAADRFC
jgi:hypothetical protein